MHTFLMIEDELWYVKDVTRAAQDVAIVLGPLDSGVAALDFVEGKPIEDQLQSKLFELSKVHNVDLVLLDTDLSRKKELGYLLQTHSSYHRALHAIGMPVCRYQKAGSETAYAFAQRLKRAATDGATAIWVPKPLVNAARAADLVQWLVSVADGFKSIESVLAARPGLLSGEHSPADVLAITLGRPETAPDFLGYSSQNFQFFVEPTGGVELDTERRYATRLGYWLYNYIMTFPGPLLSEDAASAFLNIEHNSFKREDVQALIRDCRYVGPFQGTGEYYWRDLLTNLVMSNDGDIARAAEIDGQSLTRIDPDPSAIAYLCLLSGELIRADEAAPGPDWIPPGAHQARIKGEHLEQLGPLLGM